MRPDPKTISELEYERVARVVRHLFMAIIGTLVLVGLAALGISSTHIAQTAGLVVALLLCIGGLHLSRIGHARKTAGVLAFVMLFAGTSSMLMDPNPALFSGIYILTILLSGLVLPTRVTIGLGFALSGTIVGVGLAQDSGLIELRRPSIEMGFTIMQALVVLLCTVLVSWSAEGFQDVIRQLRSNQARYFGLFARSKVAILIVSRDHRIEYANPAAQTLLGQDPEGAPLTDLPIDGLEGAIWGGESSDRLSAYLQLRGERRRVEVSTMSMTLPDGWSGWQIQLHDQGEVDRARSELRATQELLFQAQRMESLGQLASGVSHDFNNLLTVIRANTEMLTESLSAEGLELTGEILEASEGAGRLARQLMNLGRNDRLDVQLIHAGEHLSQYAPMLRRMIGAGVALTIHVDDDAPVILIDPGQLEQIISNLAINAAHAMDGEGSLEITVAGTGTQQVLILVQDSGEGMSADTLAHIFEPFFTTRGTAEGTGLGLAVVNGIITQAGGHTAVDSTRGEGTCFTLSFPRFQMVPTWTAGAGPTPLETWPLSGLHLLLVAHEHRNPSATIELFEKSGAQVTSCSSASAVLDLASDTLERFDLLICEMIMPGMSGHSLHARLAARGVHLPAVFRTGTQQRAVLDSHAFVLRDSVGPGVLLQVCAHMAGDPAHRSTRADARPMG
jgi:signal transduction histidine kinase